ncbi:MAG TPA: VTT domain-containing protein [Chryseolinea sp.]|nr:VTT domain-containing protein [Chryseolinea sp.]
MGEETSKNQSFWKKYGLLGLSVLLIGSLVACYFIFPDFKRGVDNAWEAISSDDQERIRAWVKRFGILGPIVLILVMTFQIFLLFVPNLLLFIIAIVCYGPIWGTLISLIGVAASSSLGYFIGSKVGPRTIDRFVSQKTQDKMSFFVHRYGVKAIFIFRLSSLSSDALGFVAGILEMNYKRFMLATLAGIVPVIALLAIYGESGKIEQALIWVGAFALAALIVYVFIDKNKRKTAFHKIEEKH